MLYHDEGRAGDQTVRLEQTIDRRFRHKIAFRVGEARRQFSRRQLRHIQGQIDDPLADIVRNPAPDLPGCRWPVCQGFRSTGLVAGEKKYYLANLPAKTKLRTLAATIKARWICEQAHQHLKEELGLDHFEGRSWQGLQTNWRIAPSKILSAASVAIMDLDTPADVVTALLGGEQLPKV
ncbi:SRSO17 transposase [Nitrobacteraceae bacterium AZCC 2146]